MFFPIYVRSRNEGECGTQRGKSRTRPPVRMTFNVAQYGFAVGHQR
jgi:hypothetical protein